MEKQDLDILISEALQDLESGEGERHEVHARLHMVLDRMRAFSLPLPAELVELEQTLAAEFEVEAKTAKAKKA